MLYRQFIAQPSIIDFPKKSYVYIMKATLWIFWLLLTIASSASAQSSAPFDGHKMNRFFDSLATYDQVMGSVSIFQQGEEVYRRSIGYASLASNRKATVRTRYRIGSISKTYTATIILQMAEEGKLTLDTRLAKYFPDIPNAGEITVEQMLRHRSGLANFTNLPAYRQYMEEPQTQKAMLKRFRRLEPAFAPGAEARYSNTNYVLLSYIAEEEDGKPFKQILEDRIVSPLGLPGTYVGEGIDPTKQNGALSYQWRGGWKPATETDLSIPLGAGAVVSTPTGLNRFFHALFQGKLLEDTTLARMRTLKENFGMGLFQIPFYERRAFGHNGGIDGFQSSAAYFPDAQVAVAFTGNALRMPMNDVLIGVLSIYFGRPYEIPSFAPEYEPSVEELEAYAGNYGSDGFSLDVRIFLEGEQLMGQATGQPAFPLSAKAQHRYRYRPAGLEIKFMPGQDALLLRQGGGEYRLERE